MKRARYVSPSVGYSYIIYFTSTVPFKSVFYFIYLYNNLDIYCIQVTISNCATNECQWVFQIGAGIRRRLNLSLILRSRVYKVSLYRNQENFFFFFFFQSSPYHLTMETK